MTVYLIHFAKPISDRHTTQHYIGYTDDLDTRLDTHRRGLGCRLAAVAKERGIDFVLARTWEGDRATERQIKRWKSGPKLCPICNPKGERIGR